jgi:uncharacterized protein
MRQIIICMLLLLTTVGVKAQNLSKELYTKIGNDAVIIEPLRSDIIIAEKDVRINGSDGAEISMNVYRPKKGGRVPVIMSFTSYGKDVLPAHNTWSGKGRGFRYLGQDYGSMRVSTETSFEAADPNFWVPHGYAVIVVDAVGTGKSTGKKDPFSPKTVASFVKAIEWAADQPWSTGKVGSQGVSYLGIIQWYLAEQNPRGLAAVNVWEGMSDIFRDGAYHGGIKETSFIPRWLGGEHGEPASFEPKFGLTDLPKVPSMKDVTDYIINPTKIENIKVPVLVTGNFQTQGLHTRGSFEAYKRLQTEKYLYTHRGHEWTVSNSPEAHEYQKAFFDLYLKGDVSTKRKLKKVRLEVRSDLEKFTVREEADWPLPGTNYKPLYLNAFTGQLEEKQPTVNTMTQYNSVESRRPDIGVSVFRHTFTKDTELVGNAKLKAWVSTSKGNDMDIFVNVRKVDKNGKPVKFWFRNAKKHTVSTGWLRVSLRKLDPARSTEAQPFQSYDEYQAIKPNEIVPVEIEILPMSVLFEKGSTLELVFKGSDIIDSGAAKHTLLVNQGEHRIFAGQDYDSYLLLPFAK